MASNNTQAMALDIMAIALDIMKLKLKLLICR